MNKLLKLFTVIGVVCAIVGCGPLEGIVDPSELMDPPKIAMVWIAGGTFTMGSPSDEAGRV
jgi:formylglycine-generating enzyme required for sulfatase activity